MEQYNALSGIAGDLRQLNRLARTAGGVLLWDFEEQLLRQNKVILVTNRQQQIIFASQNIFQMNGYTAPEIIGKTLRIFQGPDTDPVQTAIIRQAIKTARNFHVPLLNYKKNGQLYHCDIKGFPAFNRRQEAEHFIAFETMIQQAV